MKWKLTLFAIGFMALSLEIYCIKALFLFIPQSEVASSLVISSFLAGIALSNFAFSKLGHRPFFSQSSSLFWILIGIGIYSSMALQKIEWIPALMDFFLKEGRMAFLGVSILFWIFLFVPALILGGTLPLVLKLSGTSDSISSQKAASLYFWDTAGGILGSLLTGLVLIPQIGMNQTLLLLSVLSTIVALFYLPSMKVAALALLPMMSFFITAGHLKDFSPIFVHKAPKELNDLLLSRSDRILFQKDSPYGWVTVTEKEIQNLDVRTLWINGRVMCNSLVKNDQSEVLLGKMTTDLVMESARILNIGLGCGFTASQIADSKKTRSLKIIEINPTVVEAAKTILADDNKNLLSRSNTSLSIEDGAAFLRNTRERFNAIVIDIEEVNIIHSSPLYTKEYFEIAKARLLPNGAFLVWSFPVNPDFSKVMLNTLRSAYKNVDYKYFGQAVVYFASDSPFTSEIQKTLADVAWQKEVESSPVTEINILSNPKLSKYYDFRKVFGLPETYVEKGL